MFIGNSPILGAVDLTQIDIVAPGGGSGRSPFLGQVVSGYDSILGAGEFIYLQVPASTAIGQTTWVELDFSLDSGAKPLVKAKAWAGTANTGKTLAIALADYASVAYAQYGWFQIGGVAVSKVAQPSGVWAAGCPVAWNASGVVQNVAVSTKNVQNAQGMTAISTQIGVNTGSYSPTGTAGFLLTATQALVFLNRPVVEINS